MHTIEKNITKPEMGSERHSITNFLKSLGVGDSFLCNEKRRKCFFSAQERSNIKLTAKKQSKDCYRVWRIA
jgi:hypothetical protein